MSSPRPPDDTARHQRIAAIQRLMADVRASLEAGRSVNEHSIMAAHPELMPELGEAFKALWRLEDAAQQDAGAAETIIRPGKAQDAASAGETATRASPGASGGSRDRSAAPSPSSDEEEPSHAMRDALERMQVGAGGKTMQIPGYSVQRELSRGGQAVVFLAIQLNTGRKVALKVMREGPFADERSLARFQREVQILAALDHPNIVSIIDTGKTADGSHFIAMPYIAGVTLDEYMQRRQPKDAADPSKLLRMFYKICMAVNEAHLRGIVHRDLKPSNIRVDERGEPHVLDFGLARTALDRFIRGSNRPVSITGEFMGSLPWSSPEQAEGDPEKIDTRTDVYSLGVVLYQMLTGGRFPYEVVGNIRDVLNNILTSEPKPPSQVIAGVQAQKAQASRDMPAHSLPAVNEIMERIVLKALSKRKEMRYQNAGELAKDVARYLLGKQVKKEPTPVETGKPADRPNVVIGRSTRKPLIYAAMLAGLIVVLGVAGILWHSLGGNKAGEKNPMATGGESNSPTTQESPPIVSNQSPLSGQQTVDLMKLVDLSRDTRSGVWTQSGAELTTNPTSNCVLAFPYRAPQEYDYCIVFERKGEQSRISFLLTGGDRQFVFNLGVVRNTVAGFTLVDNQLLPGNRTAAKGSEWTKAGQQQRVLIKVRKNRTEAYLDDKFVTSIDTDYHDVSLPSGFSETTKANDTLGIGTLDSFVITSATITPINSQAIPSRPSSPNGQFAYGINGGTVTAYINGKQLMVAQGFKLQEQPVTLVPGDRIVLRATGNGQGWKAIGFAFNGTGETPSFYSTTNSCTVRNLANPQSTPIPNGSMSAQRPKASTALPGRVIQSAGDFKLNEHIEWLMLDGQGCSEFFFIVPGAQDAPAPVSGTNQVVPSK